MDHANQYLSPLLLSSSIAEKQIANAILRCNESTEKYGLALTEKQALALAQTRSHALAETRRIELNGGIVDQLILAFSPSPHLTKENYEETLHELIGLFYALKNDTWDRISDRKIIDFLQESFDGVCHGSFELLSGMAIRLSAHIRLGNPLKTFVPKEE